MTGLAANQEDGGGGEGGGGGGAVAVSLIDALQRWADALEAQIDIMKSEVEGVRAANKELTRQARMDGYTSGPTEFGNENSDDLIISERKSSEFPV